MTHTITKLPYMGKHTDKVLATPRANTLEIPFCDLRAHELAQVEGRFQSIDPYEMLTRKITHLAELLDISEQEAERVLLHRIGQ